MYTTYVSTIFKHIFFAIELVKGLHSQTQEVVVGNEQRVRCSTSTGTYLLCARTETHTSGDTH